MGWSSVKVADVVKVETVVGELAESSVLKEAEVIVVVVALLGELIGRSAYKRKRRCNNRNSNR